MLCFSLSQSYATVGVLAHIIQSLFDQALYATYKRLP
ncbi:hypothetical protein 7t3_0551 [Salmonella phage 7t3]|nr:hypothetical protein 7t3_0551 [Salmonella phage 7t3]